MPLQLHISSWWPPTEMSAHSDRSNRQATQMCGKGFLGSYDWASDEVRPFQWHAVHIPRMTNTFPNPYLPQCKLRLYSLKAHVKFDIAIFVHHHICTDWLWGYSDIRAMKLYRHLTSDTYYYTFIHSHNQEVSSYLWYSNYMSFVLYGIYCAREVRTGSQWEFRTPWAHQTIASESLSPSSYWRIPSASDSAGYRATSLQAQGRSDHPF